MAAAPPSVAEQGPAAEPLAEAVLVQQVDDAAAWWALDIAGARSVIASVAGGSEPPHWIEALLAATRIADVNHNTVHLVGSYAGRARMIGQPVIAFWPREGQPALAELIVAAAADHPRGEARTRRITSIAFADPVLRVWPGGADANPDILFVSLTGAVIDDRSLWSVRASEERYRNLIHHLPSALLQIDSRPMAAIFERLRLDGVTDIGAYIDGTPELLGTSRSIVQVTDVNRNAVELFAAGRVDRLIGPVDYLFAASPESARRVVIAHFEGRRSHAEIMKLRTFDGRLRDVQMTVTYPMPPERVDVTLITLEDITNRLGTEVQLRQLQADYTRAARISMLGELATSIAHEVNQPLSAIVTNAETSLRWLSRADPNLAKVGQLTQRIADSARHANDIVQRIRGMASRSAPERLLLDLNETVYEALLFVRHDLETRAIGLSLDLSTHLPRILGDRVQIQQVIVNLLVNAIQAITQNDVADGRIDLIAKREVDGSASFAVHDNGPGIAAQNLDRVFDGFFTTKDEGMGIGLAICQSIIAAHGGVITAANHPTGGALFRFSLPPAGEA